MTIIFFLFLICYFSQNLGSCVFFFFFFLFFFFFFLSFLLLFFVCLIYSEKIESQLFFNQVIVLKFRVFDGERGNGNKFRNDTFYGGGLRLQVSFSGWVKIWNPFFFTSSPLKCLQRKEGEKFVDPFKTKKTPKRKRKRSRYSAFSTEFNYLFSLSLFLPFSSSLSFYFSDNNIKNINLKRFGTSEKI